MRANFAESNYAKPYDRSDPSTFYGGLFKEHRTGSSVYGGLVDDEVLPAAERRHQRRRRDAAESGGRIKRYARPATPRITASEKGILVFVALFVASIFIGVIALEAYSVSIQHEINKTNAETAAVQKRIDELYVAIEDGSNIAVIEESAKADLNMVYPASSQMVYAKDIVEQSDKTDVAEGSGGGAYGT
ncbi:MAG: hypothetical protein LBG82_06465 [Clostridiales Family XIII bacterium]|jgi:cell division protein FtsL|nr:hypothetical protein [Clostridiales Family XIII bacterium]